MYRLALPLALAALVAAAPAHAQFGGGGQRSGLGMGQAGQLRPADADRQRRAPPPPGLPGLAGRPSGGPIPAEQDPAGLPPNDALFDGIARGDIATVRDAVNRGADVNARNSLDMTALDAAVDQGRPEVTFYLLSVRGTAGFAPPPERAPAAPPRRGREPAPSREARAPEPAPAQARLPVLWSGGGGAPQPEIGFLGFDAGRPAGAEGRSSRRG